MLNEPSTPTGYERLVEKMRPVPPPARTAEDDLDSLIGVLKERAQQNSGDAGTLTKDPLQALRQLTINELVPVFVELVEKYSTAGISMQMDASSFLEGGREMKFEFGVGEYRTQLLGTVTTEGIAFHETRYSPDMHGELTTGPMLRLRQLNAKSFREFVCSRLTILLRSASRRR